MKERPDFTGIYRSRPGLKLLLFFMVLVSTVKADVVPGTVSTDLFDSTLGTIVVDHDTIIDPINTFRTTGGFEDGHTLMRNGGLGSISYINFDTQSEVTIGGVRLFAHNDGSLYSYRRAMSHFKLLADTDNDMVFETTVVDVTINIDYSLQPDNKATDPQNLDITLMTAGPVTAEHWRLEVTQGTDVGTYEGARVVELDALEAAEIPAVTGEVLIVMFLFISLILIMQFFYE
jgi:hypothetical protein